jgi:hypothetical protein
MYTNNHVRRRIIFKIVEISPQKNTRTGLAAAGPVCYWTFFKIYFSHYIFLGEIPKMCCAGLHF